MPIIPLLIILTWLSMLIAIGVLLGYILPVFKTPRVYIICFIAYSIVYLLLVWSELPINLMLPFIIAVALIINFSGFLRNRISTDIPVRFISIAGIFGGALFLILYMGLFGRDYHYPEGEKYKEMAKEGYSNLTRRNPILKLFTTDYHAKIYYVKDHCPIPDDGQNPNRDYVIATYEKAIGLTQSIVYHNCGYGKFWGGPETEWEISKDKLIAES